MTWADAMAAVGIVPFIVAFMVGRWMGRAAGAAGAVEAPRPWVAPPAPPPPPRSVANPTDGVHWAAEPGYREPAGKALESRVAILEDDRHRVIDEVVRAHRRERDATWRWVAVAVLLAAISLGVSVGTLAIVLRGGAS